MNEFNISFPYLLQEESKQIIDCLQFGKKTKQYPEVIRSFAFSLHYYSPRAYNFVRDKFTRNLPDPSCIRGWVSNCSGLGEPGISAEGLRYIDNLAKTMKADGKEFYCSLA